MEHFTSLPCPLENSSLSSTRKFPQAEPAFPERCASEEGVDPAWSPDTGSPNIRMSQPHPGQGLHLGGSGGQKPWSPHSELPNGGAATGHQPSLKAGLTAPSSGPPRRYGSDSPRATRAAKRTQELFFLTDTPPRHLGCSPSLTLVFSQVRPPEPPTCGALKGRLWVPRAKGHSLDYGDLKTESVLVAVL